jgi:AraC family transcriptional regulator
MNLSPHHSDVAKHSYNGRIMCRQDGEWLPMFVRQPIGSLSPSPTLLVERHDTEPSDWQSRSIEEHVLTLFLKPTTILHATDDSSVRPISITRTSVVSSLRYQQESIRWLTPASMLSIMLADSVLREVSDELGLHGDIEILPSPGLDDPRLRTLLVALDAEREYGYPTGLLFVDAIERALATVVIKTYAVHKPQPLSQRGGLAPHALARVVEFMRENLSQQIALGDVASCAELSVAHFSRQFRQSTGATPHQYLLRVRIELSKKLLRDSKLSILEIALAAGFQSPQHLATVFRRITGTSPSLYRRQI